MGDIDCWGYESKPSLSERKEMHKLEVDEITVTQAKIDSLLEQGKETLQDVVGEDNDILIEHLRKYVKRLAETNKHLRERASSLERIENKFKTLGGKDWMTSRFYPVICSVRVSRSAIKNSLEESLSLTNKLAYFGATLNGKQNLFHKEDTILINEQANFIPLNEEYDSCNTRYTKQRTEKWLEIRNQALVTGSTCNNALRMGKLKDQQSHYDSVVLKKPKQDFSEEVKKRMEFGIKHEIDAVATVCSKVMPFLFPTLFMYEEGCIKLEHGAFDSFMVVSPDGSLRESANDPVVMAYETKCKAPDSYSPIAYYLIPLYYVTQLLCEMKALSCEKLLFTCWSEQSMTVFQVQNDKLLWQKCWTELTRVFAEEGRSRPKHFSEESKSLKKDIKSFRDNKTQLIGEFPVVRAIDSKSGRTVPGCVAYIVPSVTVNAENEIKFETVQEVLSSLKNWHNESYNQLRSVASEILVFMVSDLDRIYDMKNNNAHVVGYAMKGPSMKQDTLRSMMKDVIDKCEEHGLNIVVTSSDGQWHLYGVKDDEGKPLTIHQLQRQHWSQVRSLDKAKLQSLVKNMYVVKSLDDVNYKKLDGQLIVIGHKHDTALKVHDIETQHMSEITEMEFEDQNDLTTRRVTSNGTDSPSNDKEQEPQTIMSTLNRDTYANMLHDLQIDDNSLMEMEFEDQNDLKTRHVTSNGTDSPEIIYSGCLTGEFENNVDSETIHDIDQLYDRDTVPHMKLNDYSLPKEVLFGTHETFTPDVDKENGGVDMHTLTRNSCTVEIEDYNDSNGAQTSSTCGTEAEFTVHDMDMSVSEPTDTSSILNVAHATLYRYDQYLNDSLIDNVCFETQTEQHTELDTYATFEKCEDDEQMQEVLGSSFLDMMQDGNIEITHTVVDTIHDASNDKEQEPQTIMSTLNRDTYANMLHDLQLDDKSLKSHDWINTTLYDFISMCSSKHNMDTNLQKREVFVGAKCIERDVKDIGIRVLTSWPKYRILNLLFEEQHKVPNFSTGRQICGHSKEKKRKVLSLQKMSWNGLKHMSKHQLAVIIAEHQWKDMFLEWKSKSPIPFNLSVENTGYNDIEWFSIPRIDSDGKIRFHFTDACHLLTCLRSKLCTTGIDGLNRTAWEIAALSKDTNLNITVIVDCVDKQDVALARRVFAEDVENVMREHNFSKEAIFCRLIRRWYEAEDEPSISANERCRRLEFRQWLLDGYDIGKFPPPCRYVRGIPIITYEAMVTHLERKVQLFAFVPGSMYNVRATGTQEVEQLFSSFRDMDPSGTGTPKPDLIPEMLAAAYEIDTFRLNPEKPFFMKTSSAEVYPSETSLLCCRQSRENSTFIRTADDCNTIEKIVPSNHLFDDPVKDLRGHKRRSGKISLPTDPAHGEHGVRQYHARDDSKIPAHRRLGFLDLPDC